MKYGVFISELVLENKSVFELRIIFRSGEARFRPRFVFFSRPWCVICIERYAIFRVEIRLRKDQKLDRVAKWGSKRGDRAVYGETAPSPVTSIEATL
ncbi:hypothetical protein CEXT_236871 [Caerostris extrusa]|uniref:Uncharacterized protein n=1 Tax=Caerostris extrusa TaxID=172846 RepID=A0AAV4XUM9_CAEEX|nr:hypothetical protein CEXT_236871 [Caerostris extrusa]